MVSILRGTTRTRRRMPRVSLLFFLAYSAALYLFTTIRYSMHQQVPYTGKGRGDDDDDEDDGTTAFRNADDDSLDEYDDNDDGARKAKLEPEYIPSELEQYFMDNLDNLGYNETNNPRTCNVWTDPNVTNPSIHAKLQAYTQSLEDHTKAIDRFEPIPDILKTIQETNSHDVCSTTRLEGERVDNLFSDLMLSNTGMNGFVEPLLPPMRHHGICEDEEENLMNMNYLVHDFEAMCHSLKPTSRRVLIDMGASLSFHDGKAQPIIWLIKLFEKFGFYFDHIYGFEITFNEPENVYKDLLPEEYMASYHWINVGVEHDEDSKLNPLKSILKKFNEDDFIIVKLDIDTPSVEIPLAQQLLEDKDGVYGKLIDQFYFEHHVHLGELKKYWRTKVKGTIKDSLELFHGLRKKGIPAHFWP